MPVVFVILSVCLSASLSASPYVFCQVYLGWIFVKFLDEAYFHTANKCSDFGAYN